MFTTRRGLLAPQNTFLDTVIRRCDGPTSGFLIGNAQILDFPIIYASAGFATLMGFNRIEVLQKPVKCPFLHGPQTNKDVLSMVEDALKEQRSEQVELILYSKTLTPRWICFRIIPIRDEREVVVLFLIILRDISAYRQPLEEDAAANSALGAFAAASDAGSSWGKFARLVFSMVRQRSTSETGEEGEHTNPPDHPTTKESEGEVNENLVEKENQCSIQANPSDQSTPNKPQDGHNPPKASNSGSNPERNLSLLEKGDLEVHKTDNNRFTERRPLLSKLIRSSRRIVNVFSGEVTSLASSSRRLATSRHDGLNRDPDEFGITSWSSPDSIPRYRPEPPCPPKHVLLHYSAFRVIWDWTILLLTGYTAIVVPLRLAIIPRPTWIPLDRATDGQMNGWPRSHIPESLAIADAVIDIMFFLDIVINFHTSFVGAGGEVVAEPPVIRLNYLSGWFTLDLISCLPYEVIKYLWAGDDHSIYNLLDGLRIIRLLRIGRAARRVDQYLEYVSTLLLLMILCFFLLAHWFACAWYAVGVLDLENHIEYGWIPRYFNDSLKPQDWSDFVAKNPLHFTKLNRTNEISVDTRRVPRAGQVLTTPDTVRKSCLGESVQELTQQPKPSIPLQTGRDKWSAYVTALYFSLSLLTTIGFGNVAAFTEAEKLLSICCMLIGALVYATIFGNITTIVQQLYATRTRYNEMMMGVKDFLRIHEVPRELGERVIDYITSSWSVNKGIDTSKVLNYCPKDMQADISVHLNRCVFNTHPAFRLASDGCRRSLAVNFQTLHTAPGDLIFHQGESVDQLCFIASGSLEVLQDDEVIVILGKGDVFGNPSWRTTCSVPSAASVRALTYCTLHTIRLERLRTVLQFYHAFSNSFTRNLELNHNLCNRVIFRKLADVKREMELSMRRTKDPPLSSLPASHPVRKLISRLRRPSQGGGDLSSRYGLGTILSGDSSLEGSELESLSVSTENPDGSKTHSRAGTSAKILPNKPADQDATNLTEAFCVSTNQPTEKPPCDGEQPDVITSQNGVEMNTGTKMVKKPVTPASKWARLISKAATPKPPSLIEVKTPSSVADKTAPVTDTSSNIAAPRPPPPPSTTTIATGLRKPVDITAAQPRSMSAETNHSNLETSLQEGFQKLSTMFQQELGAVHVDLKGRLTEIVTRIDKLEQHVVRIGQRVTTMETERGNSKLLGTQLTNKGSTPIVLHSTSFEK